MTRGSLTSLEVPKPPPTLREPKQVQEAEQAFRLGLQCADEPANGRKLISGKYFTNKAMSKRFKDLKIKQMK